MKTLSAQIKKILRRNCPARDSFVCRVTGVSCEFECKQLETYKRITKLLKAKERDEKEED